MIQDQLTFEEFREMLSVRLREVREAEPESRDRLIRRAWAMTRSGVPWPVVLACTRSGCQLAFEMLESPPDTMSPDAVNPDTVNPDTVNPDTEERDTVNPAAPPLEASPSPATVLPPAAVPSRAAAPALALTEWREADAGSPHPPPAEMRHDSELDGGAPEPRPGPYEEGRVDPQDLAREAPLPLRREVGRYERERLSSATRQAIRMAHHAKRWHEIRKMRNVLMGIDQAHLKRMLGDESEALSQEINALLRTWAPLVRERQGRPMRRRR